MSEILDEIDPFPGAYTLEVSSPGPCRALRKPKHFVDAVGKFAKIQCVKEVSGRRSFTGQIVSADEDVVMIKLDEGKKGEELIFDIPFDVINRANLKD